MSISCMNILPDPTLDTPVELVRHVPKRKGPSLQHVVPAEVNGPEQLPPYLMLGPIDQSSFYSDAHGWSVVWRGVDPDTELCWRHERSTGANAVSHRWLGIAGGSAEASGDVRIEHAIGALYMPLPRKWDELAEKMFCSRWRLGYYIVPKDARAVAYFPDGPLRNIIVPVLPEQVSGFAGPWIERVRAANLPFPLITLLVRLRCDTAYVQGCNGMDHEDPFPLLARCRQQTGVDAGRPAERVRIDDGRWAWEIERHLLCVVTTVSFAGLNTALQMLDEAGILTPASEPFALRDDRPDAAAPIIVPIEFHRGTKLARWSPDQTVRVRWVLSEPSFPPVQLRGAPGAAKPH